MNIEQFRKAVKEQWLSYYAENRVWLTRLRIWVNCDGQRRPSSSFILATLSILEPELNQLLPLIVDLSSNPDKIVAALGLNFNPDEDPSMQQRLQTVATNGKAATNGKVKLLPAAPQTEPISTVASPQISSLLSKMDEACQGGRQGNLPTQTEPS